MKDSAGRHLIIDGYVKDAGVFTSDALTGLFHELVDALDMKILQGPTFLEVELDESKLSSDVFQDEGGITGSAIISTSHVAIHCWPLRRFFSMDVFSCKEFDAGIALGLIQRKLGVTTSTVVNLDRMKPSRA